MNEMPDLTCAYMLQQTQNLACSLFPLTCACSMATVQWEHVECPYADEDGSEAQPETAWKDDGSLPLDSQGQLPFFLLDAHEEASTPGLVYLFGKVTTLISCLLSPCCSEQTDCLPASDVAAQ